MHTQAWAPRSSAAYFAVSRSVLVACALLTVAPQGCAARVVVYTGVGQRGSACVLLGRGSALGGGRRRGSWVRWWARWC